VRPERAVRSTTSTMSATSFSDAIPSQASHTKQRTPIHLPYHRQHTPCSSYLPPWATLSARLRPLCAVRCTAIAHGECRMVRVHALCRVCFMQYGFGRCMSHACGPRCRCASMHCGPTGSCCRACTYQPTTRPSLSLRLRSLHETAPPGSL
jgi:hypothetical protein